MYQAVIRITIAEGNLVLGNIKGDYWCIVNVITGIRDAHQWAVACVSYRTGMKLSRWEGIR